MYPGEKIIFEDWHDEQHDYGIEFLEDRNGNTILRIWSAGFNACEIPYETLSKLVKEVEK